MLPETLESDLASDYNLLLLWVRERCPGACSTPDSSIFFLNEHNQPVARAPNCCGKYKPGSSSSCVCCQETANKAKHWVDIRLWGGRIQLVQLLLLTLQGAKASTERAELLKELKNRSFSDHQVASFEKMSCAELFRHVQLVLSCKKGARNLSLQRFMEERLSWTLLLVDVS